MSIKIGDNNKIKDATFIENSYNNEPNKKKEGFWKPVLVNIVSNIIWKILGIIATGGVIAFVVYVINQL